MPLVTGIRRLAQQFCDARSGKYPGHVHNAVGGRPVAWRYELAEDRHVVGVENTETDTETESTADNHGETVAES